MSELTSLSVKELKDLLRQHGIPLNGLVEKSDLIREARRISSDDKLSVSDLREAIRHCAGRTAGCYERGDLIERARLVLQGLACPICLEDVLMREGSISCLSCCAKGVYHRGCLGRWALESVSAGKFPVLCPQCRSVLDDWTVQSRCFTPNSESFQRFQSILASLLAQRSAERTVDDTTASYFKSLGYRPCPSCGCWIEKGPSFEVFGLGVPGCDKMTCRCGKKFCFNCGKNENECACTGPEHGFFSPEDVNQNYPKSRISF